MPGWRSPYFPAQKYENLITCDMVCHGVPSQRAFDAFCERAHLNGTCDGISFRFTEGWGFQLARELKSPTRDGKFSFASAKRIPVCPSKAWYMRAFNKSLMFNETCYSCSYTQVERVSDFTMADYWGLGQKYLLIILLIKEFQCCWLIHQRPLKY